MPLAHLHQQKIFAEIHPPHLGIGAELLRRTGTEDAALVNDVGAVSHRQRFADVMIGDQHTDAARLEREDNLLQIVDRKRIDARKWLVKQDERGLNAETAGDLNPAAFTARERISLRPSNVP